MKKAVILLALLAGAFLSARAQDSRHELNLGIGFLPRVYQEVENAPALTGDLASIYEPHTQAKGEPLYGIEYGYAVLPWLKLGASLDYTSLSGKTTEFYRGVVVNEFKHYILYFLPQAKFFAVDIPHFKVYAKLAAGVEATLGENVTAPVQFAWSVTPLGLQWAGDRVFGFTEITNGNVLWGARVGVGIRF